MSCSCVVDNLLGLVVTVRDVQGPPGQQYSTVEEEGISKQLTDSRTTQWPVSRERVSSARYKAVVAKDGFNP